MISENLQLTIMLLIFVLTVSGCVDNRTENTETLPDEGITAAGNDIKDASDTVYQFSVIDALLEGVYDGEISCAELKEQGDFGLGTFDDLDGEMLELDGVIYQVKADGQVLEVEDSITSPFAVVTFFKTDMEYSIGTTMDQQQVTEKIYELFPSRNVMYAIKIRGRFDHMKTRSVAAQEKPYPELIDVTKNQSVFELNRTEGTIVGYWMPEYMDRTNVPGYHLHFITDDRAAGGHVLDYTINEGIIEIDICDSLYLELPENQNYLSTGFSTDTEDDLEEAEN